MPAKSKAQQKLFGLARAVQKGDVPASKVGGSVKDIAKNVSKKDVEDFASTSTKGLPNKVKKESVVLNEDFGIVQLLALITSGSFVTFAAGLLAYMMGSGDDWWSRNVDKYGDKFGNAIEDAINKFDNVTRRWLSKAKVSDKELEKLKHEIKRIAPRSYKTIMSGGRPNAGRAHNILKSAGGKNVMELINRIRESEQREVKETKMPKKIIKPGTPVTFTDSLKRGTFKGKVVRFDKGDPRGWPFYVIAVPGKSESVKVPYEQVSEGVSEDSIPGGKGDKLSASNVDRDQLKIGAKVELEHTNDARKAVEIALDHLKEDPKYYTKLVGAGLVDEPDALKTAKQVTESKKPQIEWFGRDAVVHHFPKNLNPYDFLWACANVEHEGYDSYRFDDVYRNTKNDFIAVINGKKKMKNGRLVNETPESKNWLRHKKQKAYNQRQNPRDVYKQYVDNEKRAGRSSKILPYDKWFKQWGWQKENSVMSETQTRPLHVIAQEISKDWKNVNYAARPYLDAMHSLSSTKDNYGMDSGSSVVAYFLSNASSWRGPVAKRIKDELKKKLKLREGVENNRLLVRKTLKPIVEYCKKHNKPMRELHGQLVVTEGNEPLLLILSRTYNELIDDIINAVKQKHLNVRIEDKGNNVHFTAKDENSMNKLLAVAYGIS